MCSHCGERPAEHWWTVSPCAADNKTIRKKLCTECDVFINDFILKFYRVRGRTKMIEDYRKRML